MEAWKWVLLVVLLSVLVYSIYSVSNMVYISVSDGSGNKITEVTRTNTHYGDGYYL